MNTSSEMTTKLSDPEYRSSFVESQINMGLPFKIKALRKQRNWTQPQLAERAGMKQSRISAIEKPGGGKLNIDTLCRLASAFDVALDVEFIPFGELMRRSDGFDPDSFAVKSFDDEIAEDARAAEVKTGIDLQKTAAWVSDWIRQSWTIHKTKSIAPAPVPVSDLFVKTKDFLEPSAQIGVAAPYEAIKRDTEAQSVNWGAVVDDLTAAEATGTAVYLEKEAKNIPTTRKPRHHRDRGNRSIGNHRPIGGRIPTRRQVSH